MHCTAGLNTDGPVSWKVSERVTIESANEVTHAGLEPFNQGSNIACFSVITIKQFYSIYTQLQSDQFAKMITVSKV